MSPIPVSPVGWCNEGNDHKKLYVMFVRPYCLSCLTYHGECSVSYPQLLGELSNPTEIASRLSAGAE